ncbi:transposase [Tessaracoccus lacteus]|uniref:Transposase n=1 Tax=Tessaracoccus lacteus TaxID=3041766 RepID=A0ABY8PXN9_9ACTN|nr:transposase [Tessaracoccus sp. T21]WGT46927.1 transposase [Tessaracoccus sp. T21]
MVDLTRDKHGRVRARLLDLVPGRSGDAYKTWLIDRGEMFRTSVKVATLDPFHGYKNAIDDQLEDAVVMLDAFHVVNLATAAVDEVRRRIQQDIHGHRGRKNDPLYRIRNLLRAGEEHLTDRQKALLQAAFAAHNDHVSVEVAWGCPPNRSDRSTTRPAPPTAAASLNRSSRRSRPARSPRSPASAEP